MKLSFPYRTASVDIMFVLGWLGLVFLGQALLNVEVKWLEWVSIAWLIAGLILVREGTALPLLLLSCAAFLCEPQRAWAWAQPLAAMVLLARVLLERRPSRRDTLLVMLVGAFAAWVSWPADAGALLIKLMAFSAGELVTQWFRPEASWAIYPFRATADRAIIAILVAALVLNPRYISSHRIWKALFATGLLTVAVTLWSTLIPWHRPHRFLGTSNFTSYGPFLFHGAGYNACYVPILLAAALPWFFTPFSHRHRWIMVGLLGLLPPLWFLPERSLRLSVIVLLISWVFSLVPAVCSSNGRKRLVRHIRQFACVSKKVALLFLLSLVLTSMWFLKMGIRDAASPIRQSIHSTLEHGNSIWSKGVPYGNPERLTSPVATGQGAVPSASYVPASTGLLKELPAMQVGRVDAKAPAPEIPLELRFEKHLARFDPARANTWTLGLSHILRSGLWRGEGAGTWARFHRVQPRPARTYFAHMHNTYLDLAFEYGLIPMMIILGLCALSFFRIAFGYTGISRFWLFYLLAMATVALGQHLFFSFTHLCLLMPAFIVLARALDFRRSSAQIVR